MSEKNLLNITADRPIVDGKIIDVAIRIGSSGRANQIHLLIESKLEYTRVCVPVRDSEEAARVHNAIKTGVSDG